jgi:ABC-type transport system involved in multi-copper enzyme maturation permease subunit
MRLLLVEVRRLFARRFVWIGALALLAGIGAVLVITAAQSNVPDAADRARAQQLASEQAASVQADRDACEASQRPGAEPSDPATARFPPGFNCNDIAEPSAEQFLVDRPFRFTEDMEDITQALTIVLALFAFLVGATAVGAEWHHGTMAALLLWEPRRLRVFTGKLLALLGGVTVISVAGYAVSVAGHWGVARLRGVVGPITADFQRDLALVTARGFAVVLAASAAGFALAYLLRRTAAALGVLIGYFGVVEIGSRIFFNERAEPFLLTSYTAAWLSNGLKLFRYDCGADGQCAEHTINLTLWQGGLYVGSVALILVLLSAVVFRRQEVA